MISKFPPIHGLRGKPVWPGARLLKDVLPGGSWAGRPAFCVGGGPSLLDFDWRLLEGRLTIGVNRVFERHDPTIIFTMDKPFYDKVIAGTYGQEALARWRSSRALKVLLQSAEKPVPAGVLLVPVHRTYGVARRAFTFSLDLGLGHGNNSGYGALNLAVCLGASPIYLLGYDMKHDGLRTHWHSGHPTRQSEKIVAGFADDFNRAAVELHARRMTVINLNPGSALNCFPKKPREEVFRS